ncbi:MAG: DUF1697 domain-containing protein [Acidobacteriota bacterium]
MIVAYNRTMVRFVAFLRAINVGGHVVKMDRLRAEFEGMGLSSVETFIASGNVIFETKARDVARLEKSIEKRLRTALGYDVATFLRSTTDLAAVAHFQAFPQQELEVEGHALYIAFLPRPLDREAERKLMALRSEVDDFRVRDREIYYLIRTRFSESRFSGALLERTLGMPSTMRNVTTVRKLAAKYPPPV